MISPDYEHRNASLIANQFSIILTKAPT